MDAVERQLREVKEKAGGMLPLPVYRALYEAAKACGGGTIVEIGTAQGAATIVLALGARAGGARFRIHTADPFDRGTRLAVGSVAENVELVRRGFDGFGVAEDIALTVGEAAGLVGEADPRDIALLLLDADGRIDRDLALLFDRLAPSARIVIDDVDDRLYVHDAGGAWVIDQKHRLTHLLCEAFVRIGLLVPKARIGRTGFYRKGPETPQAGSWAAAAQEAYGRLVLAPIGADQIGLGAALRRLGRRRLPALVGLYRKLRYRSG